MAIYSKKSKDPTEVALSAIKDALNIRESDIMPMRSAGPAAAASAMEAPDEVRRHGARRATPEIPIETSVTGSGHDEHDVVHAANDDRESIGQILQSLQRRPARAPFIIASLFTTLWTIAALALIYGLGGQVRQISTEAGWAPIVIGLSGAYSAPIVFFYALANMVARLGELRIVSSSMAEAALRFAEPETVARDSIVTVGQAIRREVAAMGDGIERALARAAELETLVNNEVAALERAYNDNEVRIRNLLDGLAQQRETLVGQAEQVRNAITNVHLDLSHDITTVSELIAKGTMKLNKVATIDLPRKPEWLGW